MRRGPYYIAVRKNEEGEWYDIGSLCCSKEETLEKHKDLDEHLVIYTKHNPVVRIAKIDIIET